MNLWLNFLTPLDVLVVDLDVLVAVAAALLVLEAQCVEQLVLHNAMLHAAQLLQRQHLLVPLTTQ